MNIGILSMNPDLYSTRRLVEQAIERGHRVMVINPLQCYMNITSSSPTVHYKKRNLDEFDAIIPRIGSSITFYGAAVLRQFEMMGVYSINGSISITRSRDKLRSAQILSRKGVGLPITAFAHATIHTKDLISIVGGPPLVVKILEGTQGKGVVLCETQNAAESVIGAFRSLDANILIQEFISEARGADIRCFVIGEKVVASMMRQAREGEFRSNLHQGGTARLVKISPEERATAVKAARVLGLRVAGVDMLRSSDGPKVMEVNSSPGLEGIEQATRKNVAGMIIEYIEKNARPSSHRKVE
ncbi:MAG: 30S ribosomal protein S6--L-glutamate ligase [Bdellovibrionota bacterium]